MEGYRKILVAFDGSPSAGNALAQAAAMARRDKSWIKVVAVVPAYEGELELIGIGNIKETIAGPGRKLLAEARRIADVEDVHILTDLEQGEPWERIVHLAEEENCDLIILGRHGQSRIERELMGGVTARVIGHTGKDVLVVPEGTRLAWSRILLAADGSPAGDAAVERALGLAARHGSRLTVVSVAGADEELLATAPEVFEEMVATARAIAEEVTALARARDIEVESAVRDGEPHREITRLASNAGIDVIVMGSHGRKGLTRLLMGSVTERVIGLGSYPVIVSHSGSLSR